MEDKVSLQHHFQQQDNNRISFHLPAIVTESSPHREPFIQISPMPDNTLLAVGQDGVVSVWTPDLKLKKTRCILDDSKQANKKIKWISDFTLMPQYNKLIVGTCDREIRLYELSNFEPYCQIIGFETMPLHLDYSLRDADECIIYFGDEQGCINIIIMSNVAETLRNWTKCQVMDEIPSIAIDNITELNVRYIRWKVHNDWVTQIRYVHSTESIISSSNDDYTALIIGCVEGTKNLQKLLKDLMESSSMKSKRSMLTGNVPPKRNISDESLFRVKRGVKTFDFSKEANILITGGLDRIVRVWNPYVPSWPTGLLRGHSSPITYLQIGDENTKIYSVSTDCNVMVWDIENHTCLINVISKASQIKGDIAACYFSHHLRALYIATDYLSALQLQETAILHGPPSVSHSEPVTGCLYNQLYQQIISCSEGSVMKTWDLLTGQLVGEVQTAHGHSAVTCIALDTVGNRLVSGGKDGSLKLWDYTSSSLTPIRTLIEGSTAGSRDGLSDITYAEHHKNQYIVSVSYDGQIRICPDDVISEHVLPQFTWNNNMVNKHEENKPCLASSFSNMVAMSSCNGEVFVWSLKTGEPLCHLYPSIGEEVENEIGNLVINKAVFICSRFDRKKDSAVLITSGSRGYITFWNIVGGGKVFARFEGSQYKCMVNAMAVSEDDSLLCAADQLFYVYVWNITQYALGSLEDQPPVLLHCWRAHMSDITRVIPVEKHKAIVTSSQDCTVKLWTTQGEYIGTFGQNKPWCLNKTESKKEEPGDNKPSQVCGCNQAAEDEKKQMDKISEVEVSSIPIDDVNIADELKERISVNAKNRIKIVSLKQVELQQACGRLNTYKSLQICDLMSVSATIRKPNPAAELNDPYDLAF